MTPRTLIAVALLALSGMGLVSRVEGSIITLDESDIAREISDENQVQPLPFLVNFAESSPFDFRDLIDAASDEDRSPSEGMGSGASYTGGGSLQFAILWCANALRLNDLSSQLFIQGELKWTPPSPDELLRPPCKSGT